MAKLKSLLVYAIPYLSDRYGLRRYPGPLLAKISNLWFANEIAHRRNISAVHKMHDKYGTIILLSELHCILWYS